MKKKTSMRAIARELGVAPCTVSRVMRDLPGVAEETRAAVLAAAGTAGRRPNFRANTGYTVAVVLPEMQNFGVYEGRLLGAVSRAAAARGVAVEFIEKTNVRLLETRAVAGIFSLCYDSNAERKLVEAGSFPVVTVNNYGSCLRGIYPVNTDDRSALAAAVDFLVLRGHRRIALAAGNPDSPQLNHRQRCGAFLAAAEQLRAEGNVFAAEPFAQLLREIRDWGATALVFEFELNQPMKFSNALMAAGLRVPEDLSLILWENTEPAEQMSPPATAFGQDFDGLAAAAFDVLETRLRGESVRGPRLVPCRFTPGASVRTR